MRPTRRAVLTAALAAGALAAAPARRAPSDVLDLRQWELQCPTDEQKEGRMDIIEPDELRGWTHREFYADGRDVVIGCRTSGVTSPNSKYPRRELRGHDIAWSSREGTHAFSARFAVTALPAKRPAVIPFQLHDGTSDRVAVFLEGRRMDLRYDGDKVATLDTAYDLGVFHLATCVIKDGQVTARFDKRVVFEQTLPVFDSMYPKVGTYAQSNPSRGDADAYVETRVRHLRVLSR